MKILQVCKKVPYPFNDGESIAVRSLAKAFSHLGHHIDLVCAHTMKHPVDENQAKQALSWYDKISFVQIDNRINPINTFLNLLSQKPFHISRFESPAFKLAFDNLIEMGSYDLLLFESITMMYVVDEKKQNARMVLRAHNVEHIIWERIASNSPFLKKIYLQIQSKRLKKFELKSLEMADEIWAISSKDANIFQTFIPDSTIKTIPIGMDFDQNEFTFDEELKEAGFIGSLDWLPNIEGLEWYIGQILPLLLNEKCAIPLTIAGKNMPKSWHFRKIESIHFLGEVRESKNFMLSNPLFFVPLLSGGGIRTKILEAMALGRVVISTSIGIEGIPVKNGYHALIVDTPEEWVDCFQKIWKGEIKLSHISKNARLFIQENYNSVDLLLKVLD